MTNEFILYNRYCLFVAHQRYLYILILDAESYVDILLSKSANLIARSEDVGKVNTRKSVRTFCGYHLVILMIMMAVVTVTALIGIVHFIKRTPVGPNDECSSTNENL